MFKTGITRSLFSEFLKDNDLSRSETVSPHAFVDRSDGSIKIVTNFIDIKADSDDHYVVSVETSTGELEFLSTAE